MDDREKNNVPEKDDPEQERICFKVSILKDGQVIIGDVPSEILPLLKKLYPEDSQIKRSEDSIEKPEESKD